jgi:two-component system, cell cycle response regulator DivK
MDVEMHVLPRLERAPVVLAVDDEEEFLELTELFLGGAGIRVLKARSATEALWHALRTPPDLIFLDLMLPHVDGFQVLAALKSEPETRNIPVFACTAADFGDARGVLSAGFDALFPKPVNWTRLREILRSLFSRSEL